MGNNALVRVGGLRYSIRIHRKVPSISGPPERESERPSTVYGMAGDAEDQKNNTYTLGNRATRNGLNIWQQRENGLNKKAS